MKKVTMTKELALELLDFRIIGIMSNLSEWEALGDVMPDDMREELETNLALYQMAYDALSGPQPDPITGLVPLPEVDDD